MKTLKSIVSIFSLSAIMAVSCEKGETLSDKTDTVPDKTSIELGVDMIEFSYERGEKSFTVLSNADWTASFPEWIKMEPAKAYASDKAVDVTVSVEENRTGEDLNGTVIFSAGDTKKEVVVTQMSRPQAEVIYSNDFDKNDVGSDKPSVDDSDDWKNETGSGTGSLTYLSSGVSVRTSNSSSSATVYDASGVNNIFFGRLSYLQINGIKINSEKTDYVLSFGAFYDGAASFRQEQFSVYASIDGIKWTKLAYTLADASAAGWNKASTIFGVPAGTTSMNLYFTASEASKYRIDDLSLNESFETGANIDFNNGIEFGTTKEVSVSEFLSENPNTIYKYRLSGTVTNVDGDNVTIEDGGASVILYKVDLNGKADVLANGDKVTVTGNRDIYNGTAQMSNGILEEVIKKPVETAGNQLIITEYVEGTEDRQTYLEIYNPTSETIEFKYMYSIKIYPDGSTYGYASSLNNGSIGAGETIVYRNTYATLWDGDATPLTTAMDFDGNDYLELIYKSEVIDAIGTKGDASEFAKDITLRRKPEIKSFSGKYNPDEWEKYEANTVDGLGIR